MKQTVLVGKTNKVVNISPKESGPNSSVNASINADVRCEHGLTWKPTHDTDKVSAVADNCIFYSYSKYNMKETYKGAH